MKRLLLSCTINPLFLRTADGIKFVVYLFSIYHPFVDELHMTIKAQVRFFSSSSSLLTMSG
jgi:hypothetical protein